MKKQKTNESEQNKVVDFTAISEMAMGKSLVRTINGRREVNIPTILRVRMCGNDMVSFGGSSLGIRMEMEHARTLVTTGRLEIKSDQGSEHVLTIE